jgi:glycosyltransferase involved in cell wall biosynthesis
MLTYNQADFVSDAIQSVINQSYPNIQLVISDDASSDDTPAIIKDFYEKNPKVILPNINQSNIGITKNFNLALERCDGEYVALLDGDDIFFPGKLSHQQKFMCENPQFTITYHDVEVFLSTTGEHIYNWKERFIGKNISTSELVRYGPVLPYPGIMIMRECMPLKLDESISVGSDWLLWIESLINCNSQAGFINLTLGRYRRHSGNITKDWDWKIEDQLSTLAIVEKTWPDLSAASKKRKAEIYLIDTILNLRKREFGKALKAVGLMFKCAYPNFLILLRLPIRELIFFIRARGRVDDLVESLFTES